MSATLRGDSHEAQRGGGQVAAGPGGGQQGPLFRRCSIAGDAGAAGLRCPHHRGRCPQLCNELPHRARRAAVHDRANIRTGPFCVPSEKRASYASGSIAARIRWRTDASRKRLPTTRSGRSAKSTSAATVRPSGPERNARGISKGSPIRGSATRRLRISGAPISSGCSTTWRITTAQSWPTACSPSRER
jgi:hypothetical protein